MHKCHNYHAILHKLYMWFDKNELKQSKKIFRLGGAASKYAHGDNYVTGNIGYTGHEFVFDLSCN